MAHRTQGDGYVEEDGKRLSVPSDLPTSPATKLPAELVNMLQEEICNTIEKCGLTIEPTALEDRNNGWEQLYKAIFKSAHGTGDMLANNSVDGVKLKDASVTSDKIKDVDLEIAFGVLRLSYEIPLQTGFAIYDQVGVRAQKNNDGDKAWSEFQAWRASFGAEAVGTTPAYGAVYSASSFGFVDERYIKYKSIKFSTSDFTDVSNLVAHFNSGLPKDSRVLHAEFSYKSATPQSGIYDRQPMLTPLGKTTEIQFDSLFAESTLLATVTVSDTSFALSTTATNYELNVWYAPNDGNIVTLPTEVT